MKISILGSTGIQTRKNGSIMIPMNHILNLFSVTLVAKNSLLVVVASRVSSVRKKVNGLKMHVTIAMIFSVTRMNSVAPPRVQICKLMEQIVVGLSLYLLVITVLVMTNVVTRLVHLSVTKARDFGGSTEKRLIKMNACNLPLVRTANKFVLTRTGLSNVNVILDSLSKQMAHAKISTSATEVVITAIMMPHAPIP